MKKLFILLTTVLFSGAMMAEMTPIYYEGFSRCFDDEGENYGYTGGNDEQWGGDVASAVVIYQDAPEWMFNYCNAGYQCLKVGTSQKQGTATTPTISCEGEVQLSFRVAPWEGDSIFFFTVQGGQVQGETYFHLKKHQWTTITTTVEDIQSGIRITFSSTNKHRFFLDDVCVRPADPTVGAIRTVEGSMVDFGLVGRSYSAQQRTLHVEGANLAGTIALSLEEGEPELFQLSTTSLPSHGGEVQISLQEGASVGQTGCYLYLRGTDAQTSQPVVKRVTLLVEVVSLNLEGSGTKPDPYTCSDVILLAANEGTVWTGTYYWVTGYVLGGVHRYNNLPNGDYDGISYTDSLSLVLAAQPNETDETKYVTVQISENARAALNVVDNPELIGQRIKVQGLLLNDNANPLYLGKPGVRNVRTDAQYVLPEQEEIQAIESPTAEPSMEACKILYNGHVYILYNGKTYIIQ